MTIDFMHDFETMDKTPTSVVLNYAFIPFERNTLKTFQEYVKDAVFWKFDTQSQILDNRTISTDTLDWWDQQDSEVKRAAFEPLDTDVDLDKFIVEFGEMYQSSGLDNWSLGYCRGQSFDFPILADILRKHSSFDPTFYPCAFWNQMDVRSYIKGLLLSKKGSKVPLPLGSLDGFKVHDPIDDCARAILQIKYAELYAQGIEEVPEASQVDPNSYK